MRLRMAFSTDGPWESAVRALQLPMEITLVPHGKFRVDRWSFPTPRIPSPRPFRSDALLVIVAERHVDPGGMRRAEDHVLRRKDENGDIGPAFTVDSLEIDDLAEGAGLVLGALSFSIGIALPLSSYMSEEFPSEYLPDCDSDRQLLRELGSYPRFPLLGRTATEVFEETAVDAEFVQALARRRAVRTYPEALHETSATATLRDLWRTLELAFQAEGRELTNLLAEFGPARRLGFDREELEELRAVRGQISHASSRLGPRAVSQSETAANRSLGRLWSLVDWVILSKKDASRSLDEEELRPLAAFIRRDGATQIEPQVDDPETWQMTYGIGANPRFRVPD